MKPITIVNYFSGWWSDEEPSSKWLDPIDGHDWRPEYVSRIPLNGFYNGQDTTDRDLISASSHGIDCFQMLWYPVDSPDTAIDEPHRVHLNEGIEFFMASKQAHRMCFMVEYCNHPPFNIQSREEWRKCCAIWSDMMAHPSYLHVDGRPLFKIHGLTYFFEQCHRDWKLFAQRIDDLRQAVKERCGSELLLSGGIVAEEPQALRPYLAYIDYFSTYMDMGGEPTIEENYPYELLVEHALRGAKRYGEAGIPYQPYLPVGWCPRPWHDPRPCYAIPNGAQIETAARALIGLMDRYPSLGIPGGHQAFSVYAWNEFGEGGYLAPTLIEGYEKLKGLRRALQGI